MNSSLKAYISILLLLLPSMLPAAEQADSAKTRKGNIISRIIEYFDDSNEQHDEKPFDVSFIGGPYYSSDTKLGLGLVASGLYRHDRADTILPPSNVSLRLKATTSGYFETGIDGIDIWKNDRCRLTYNIGFYHVDTKFWGIGYDSCSVDENETPYKYFATKIKADLTWRIAPALYAGPSVSFDYFAARDIRRPALWEGQRPKSLNFGVGLTLNYDTRDNTTAPQRGVYLSASQRFNPRFLGNRNAFSMTEVRMSSYNRLWRGGVLASQIHGCFTYGDTPWTMMPTLGGSDNMRGYFEGRYRDKSEFDLCIELRQHVWRRSGAVVWGGVASVFDKFSDITFRRLLPNYGLGYRWEFKKNVNIRLDVGFGRRQTGIIFSINEAF